MDVLPHDDWLHKVAQLSNYNTILSPIKKKEWELYGDFRIVLKTCGMNFRIVIQDCSKHQNIEMTATTWSDFSSKVLSYFPAYANSSMNFNNQLMGFSLDGVLKLQQCFYNTNSKCFWLSANYVDIPWETLEELKKAIPEIMQEVCNTNFQVCLPEAFKNLQCASDIHSTYDTNNEYLLLALEDEILSIFKILFRCERCEVNHPSQYKHLCISTPAIEKFRLHETDIFSRIKFKPIIDSLKSKGCVCVCYYYQIIQNHSFYGLKLMLTELIELL